MNAIKKFRKTLKIIQIITMMMIIAGCGDKSVSNISTSEAYTKYEKKIESKSLVVFSESRENPLKWVDSIPENRLIAALDSRQLKLSANPGEIFVYQIGVWATNRDLNDLQVYFSDLKGKAGNISSSKMACYNLGGTDIRGNAFSKQISIPRGRLQDLWIGMDLDSVVSGTYKGSVTVASGSEKIVMPVALKVSGNPVLNNGYDEGARLSRLNWLNSRKGINNEVTKGFIPVKIEGNSLSILGRTLAIAGNGLPASIVSYFKSSNQYINEKGEYVVHSPFRFIIEKQQEGVISLVPGEIVFSDKSDAGITWKVTNSSEEADLEVSGRLEFDGFVDYTMKLTAKRTLKIRDIRLEVPVVKDKAEYMMGLGHEGGLRTPGWKWKWDVSKNQDMLWIGSVNGGIRLKLKAENYVRPLINVYYKFGPLKMPTSWGNGGKGGVDITDSEASVIIKAYSGGRTVETGEILNYDFELLLTPFRTIDRNNKFNDRYYHGGGASTTFKIDSAKKYGANIINIHHAEDIYPFINYPYLDANVAELTRLVSDAHDNGIRMKFYYTTRELTKNLPEFWPFYSLDGEIIFPGPGNDSKTVINPKGPNEWLVKNLREKYIPAWYNEIKEGKFKGETDLSVITTPDSRLNNFYVAGLEWMVKNIGIDGVYIDDSALDRFTVQRARKVIDESRPEGRMDLHSWNHFNEWAGFTNCLNLYMDMLPYFDLVWIGEGRDYNRNPDHWLIEVSGIPFGLPGQMLEGGGNPWRGMVYGITNRAGWVKNPPHHLWKFFDKYKFSEREMLGYWDRKCPVRTDNPKIVASVFKGSEDLVIAVANWSDKEQVCRLIINWKALGTDQSRSVLEIPFVENFQDSGKVSPADQVKTEGGKGFLIVLKIK
jgi:hypothetical protein